MNTGIVIVTHDRTGRSLIDVAESILGRSLEEIRFVPFSRAGAVEADQDAIRQAIREADEGAGVLVITDLMGASPCNHITPLLDEFPARLVTGLNLAMLIRVWNYRNHGLDELARKAVEGGRRDIRVFST